MDQSMLEQILRCSSHNITNSTMALVRQGLSGRRLKRKRTASNEVFIGEIGKYRCLFDKHSKEFKNTHKRQTLWGVVGAKLGMSGEEVEKKWRVQRDRYNKEKKKISESVATGCDASEVYVPSWHLYSLMDSIMNGTAVVQSESLTTATPEGVDDTCPALAEDEQQHIICEVNGINSSVDDTDDSQAFMESNSHLSCHQPSSTPSPRRTTNHPKKRDSVDGSELNDVLQSLACTTSSLNTLISAMSGENSGEDRLDKFCCYLKTRLRALTKKDQHEALKSIELVLLEIEGKEIYM